MTEEVVKVAVNDLIGSWDARRDLWPIEDAVRAGVVAAEQAQAATIASLRAELAEARSKGMMEEAGLIEDADPEYAEFIRQKAAETAAGTTMTDRAGLVDNQTEGQHLYAAGDEETRDWFHRQWKAWPKRVDERLTTNGSLHYGGLLAYRIERGEDPEMSDEFRIHVDVMDRFAHLRREALG